ncbi:hypothetical protein [Antrihabitans spumae]|jgi:hypothetical protein|uniref:Secreted protein n=1 Tax=Antrihabitans spumae TaxID=3373370 RepID=A0ABW7JIV9_9NOCA
MTKRALATVFAALALAVPVATLTAPVAVAADPPPIINIPVEALPYIEVPPAISDQAAPLGAGIRDGVTDYNNENPDQVKAFFGALSGFSCAVSGLFGKPCKL